MVKKSIIYFEQSGPENTDDVIELVYWRLKEDDIKSVVVASSSGKTGLKFAKQMSKDTNIVVVSCCSGFKQPGVWDFDLDILKELDELGCKVVKQTHVLSGLEQSFTNKFSSTSYSEFLAESIRSLFCQGIKVAVECTIMALDSGAISPDKTIAIGGTGEGADTAVVVLPSHTNNFFDFRVLEIIAKPFNRDW